MEQLRFSRRLVTPLIRTVGSYFHVVVEPSSDQSSIELKSLYFSL